MKTSPLPQSGARQIRKPVTDADFRVYRAITGNVPATNILSSTNSTTRAGAPRLLGAFAKRVLGQELIQVSARLREFCEMGIANGVKRAQMSEWLRHVSDEAFKRLDQAQARLSQSGSTPRRHVDAREVRAQVAEESDNLQNVA